MERSSQRPHDVLDLGAPLGWMSSIIGFLTEHRADARKAHPSPLKVVSQSQECIVATLGRRATPPLDRCRLAPRLIGLSLPSILLGNQLAHSSKPWALGCRQRLPHWLNH